jgi:formylglycine-generating enzyme required for sulfatase activity
MAKVNATQARATLEQMLTCGSTADWHALLVRRHASAPRWLDIWRVLWAEARPGPADAAARRADLQSLLERCLDSVGPWARQHLRLGDDDAADFVRRLHDVTWHLALDGPPPAVQIPRCRVPKGAEASHFADLLGRWFQAAVAQQPEEAQPQRRWQPPDVAGSVTMPVLLVSETTRQPIEAVLTVHAVPAPGARLSWLPAPASALVHCDGDWQQALADVRAWIACCVDEDRARDLALAWDMVVPWDPAAGVNPALPRAPLLLGGNSAGAVMAVAALFLLQEHAHSAWPDGGTQGPGLRDTLSLLSANELRRSAITAAVDVSGCLSPVGGADAKALIARAWTQAAMRAGAGIDSSELHLARDGGDSATVEGVTLVEHRSLRHLLEHLARRSESMTDAQLHLFALLCGRGERVTLPARPDGLLNSVIESPCRSLRQYLLRCWAEWERRAGGQVHQRFVPLKIEPLEQSVEAKLVEGGSYDSLLDLTRCNDALGRQAYVLRGPPGAGKTTLLRHHLQCLARDALCQLGGGAAGADPGGTSPATAVPLEVPVYLPLRAMEPKHADRAAWLAWADRQLAWAPQELRDLLRGCGPWHRQGWRARVMLDGLNELPVAPGQDRARRAADVVQGLLQGWAAGEGASLPRPASATTAEPLPMLLSIRSHELLALSGVSTLNADVLEWDRAAIDEYLDRVFPQPTEALQRRLHAFRQDAAALSICRRPLHLAQYADLLRAGFTAAPTDRAALYRAWMWMRLRRELGRDPAHPRDVRPEAWSGLLGSDDWQLIDDPRCTAGALPGLPPGELFGALRRLALAQWEADPTTATPMPLAQVAGTLKQAPELHIRWLSAVQALGVARVDPATRLWEWAHQSVGEYFAACDLLAGGPQRVHPLLAERLRLPPLAGDSDEEELRLLEESGSVVWRDPALAPVWQELLSEPLAIDEREFFDGFFDNPSTSAEELDGGRQRVIDTRLAPYGWVGEGGAFTLASGEVFVDLRRFGDLLDVGTGLSLRKGQDWTAHPLAWQRLVHECLWTRPILPAFRRRLHAVLLVRQLPDKLNALMKEQGRLELPAAPPARQVLGLALLSEVHDDAAQAWLQWLVLNGHALALGEEVLPALQQRLERQVSSDHDLEVPPGHGPQRAPVLEHLRRVLLLTSVDAGRAARRQVLRSGLMGLLATTAQRCGGHAALQRDWQQRLHAAFRGSGQRLRHRLLAGLMLGRLGDNIRFEHRAHRGADAEGAGAGEADGAGLRPRPELWAAVPAGRYLIGSWVGFTGELPPWRAELTAFAIARLPLTMGEWACFARSRAGQGQASISADYPEFNNPLQPATGISWRQACAYAKWAAGLYRDAPGAGTGPPASPAGSTLRLPTELEWEAAARGPEPGWLRPWRWWQELRRLRDPLICNHRATRWLRSSPVGVFSGSPSELALDDALGNVWEFTASAVALHGLGAGWTEDARAMATQPLSPAEVNSHTRVALRGGANGSPAGLCRPAFRSRGGPDDHYYGVGVRLVWSWAPHSWTLNPGAVERTETSA